MRRSPAFSYPPGTSLLQALRASIRPFIGLALLHAMGSLPALIGDVDAQFAVLLVFLLALQPITALTLIFSGVRLSSIPGAPGPRVRNVGIAYGLALSVSLPFLNTRTGQLLATGAAAGMVLTLLPLAGSVLSPVLRGAHPRILKSLAWASPGFALMTAYISRGLPLGPFLMAVAVVTVSLSLALYALLVFHALRPHPTEELARALVTAGPQSWAPELELLQDSLPIRLRYRRPLERAGTLRSVILMPTPLGNPILDSLLTLRSTDPQASAALLSGHEDTVLALLHAWPRSRLRTEEVVWEASLEQLSPVASQAQLADKVQQTMAQTRALVALLDGHEPGLAISTQSGRTLSGEKQAAALTRRLGEAE